MGGGGETRVGVRQRQLCGQEASGQRERTEKGKEGRSTL